MKTLKGFLTHEVKQITKAYLMDRAYAETMREKVDNVYRGILTECPVYSTAARGRESEQILDVEKLYMCDDEPIVKDVYAEGDKRLRDCKLKPAEMDKDICPALSAESLQIDVENQLINISGNDLGVSVKNLIDLDHRKKWIDLVVKIVVNSPGFKMKLI